MGVLGEGPRGMYGMLPLKSTESTRRDPHSVLFPYSLPWTPVLVPSPGLAFDADSPWAVSTTACATS